jgi:hypothetical protein
MRPYSCGTLNGNGFFQGDGVDGNGFLCFVTPQSGLMLSTATMSQLVNRWLFP